MSRAAMAPGRSSGVDRLVPRSLGWKELRLLGTVAVPLLVIEAGVVIGASAWLGEGEAPQPGTLAPTDLLAWSLGLWGLLLGSLGFGLDREARTLPWLAELPISSWRTLGTKTAVATLAFLLVLVGRGLVLGTSGLPADGWAAAGTLARVALAFVVGGWFALTDRRRWVTRLLVAAALVGWWWADSASILASIHPGLSLAVSPIGILVGALAIRRRLQFPWLGPPRVGRAAVQEAESTRAPIQRSLAWLERQLYQRVWWLGLLAPVLLLLTPKARSLPWLFFFPIPFVTAWNGAGLVANEERDGSSFFLHQLPIAARRIYGRRLLWALALGPILVLEASLLAWLCQWLGTTDLLWQPDIILPTLGWVMTLLATLATLVAAALAPWLPERALSTVLSLLTVLLFVSASGSLQNPVAEVGLVLTVAGVGLLALRSCFTHRAFASTPMGRTRSRWLAIGALLVLWWVLLALQQL